jgi:hypothetical protein
LVYPLQSYAKALPAQGFFYSLCSKKRYLYFLFDYSKKDKNNVPKGRCLASLFYGLYFRTGLTIWLRLTLYFAYGTGAANACFFAQELFAC